MGYAFISYSSKEQSLADSLRLLLQKNSIATWMAPLDIPAGSKYAQVINRAIKECSCVVLMLSNAAQQSIWVAKEIERAENYRKPIIPLQIEEITLNDEFEFYLCTYQIVAVKQMDADTPEIQKVLASVKAVCGTARESDTPEEKYAVSQGADTEADQLYQELLTYSQLKDKQKPLEWYKRAYELRCKVLGEEHPDTLVVLNCLAFIYNQTKDYANAQKLYEKLYAMQCKMLGELHPDVMKTLKMLMSTYNGLGNFQKVSELQEKVLTILIAQKMGGRR